MGKLTQTTTEVQALLDKVATMPETTEILSKTDADELYQPKGSGLTEWQSGYLSRQEAAERQSKYAVSLSLSPVSAEFTGEATGIVLTAAARYDGQTVQGIVTPTSSNIQGVTFTAGRAETIWNAPAISQGKVSVSYCVNISYNDGYGELVKSATASQTRYAPIRFVCKPGTDTPTGDQIKAGIKTVKSSATGEYTIPFAAGDYVWLCFPAFMTFSGFTSGGFAVPVENAVAVTCPIGGTEVSYKCVRITGAPKTSPIKIKVS